MNTETVAGKKVKFYGMYNLGTMVLIGNDRRNANGLLDASLVAHSLGIGSVWNNALCSVGDETEIQKLLAELGLVPRHQVCAMLCRGYPAETSKKIQRRQVLVIWV